jgi:F-type H+-transporting ATPase subunit b
MSATPGYYVLLTVEGGEAEGGEATEAHEEHHENNFFYSDINEVIWGSLAFLIIFALFLWKGVPAIKKAMAKRSERIANEIASAEAAHADANAELESLRASLSNVDSESQRIIAEARDLAEVVKRDLSTKADNDVRETVQRARIEIESSKAQALADLREEVVRMTVQATEAVLAENLTAPVQSSLVDRYIDRVGSN